MASSSSRSDAASSSSSSSSSSSPRHRGTSKASRRPVNLQYGSEPYASSSSDPAEHVSGSRTTRPGHDHGNLSRDYSKQWNVPPFDWIKAFMVTLLVLQAVTSSHHDALSPAESAWPPANTGIHMHGTDLCTSERRCKRHPDAAGKPGNAGGTPCWTWPCQKRARAADADQDAMCSSDNDGQVVQCRGCQQDDDVSSVPSSTSSSENLWLPLHHQSADETMDASSSTITHDDLGGDDDEVNSTGSTDHGDDDAASISGNRSIPDGIDGLVQQLTGLDSSTDASMEVQQTAVDDQISSVPWSSIPGLRFLPTDLEIVLHCLRNKIFNLELPGHDVVREGVDIHRTNADAITLNSNDGDKEQVGFFFVRKDQAYTNGCWYPTPGGYWKVRQGQPAAIRHGDRVVAFKTSMDYFRGRAPHGRRMPWSMAEYALNACHDDLRNLAQPTMNSFVVCKVWKRTPVEAKKKTSSVLRRFGLTKSRAVRDRAPKPKARRLVCSGARGEILGKRMRPEL